MRKGVLYIFGTTFVIGILFLLATGDASLDDVLGMTLSGVIISIFSGIGFLCELYLGRKSKK